MLKPGLPPNEQVAALFEMNRDVWDRLEATLADIDGDEIDWRPVPEANSINVIVRHLRIEAEWHANSLRDGAPMPSVAVPVSQDAVDAVTLDFGQNVARLSEHQTSYLESLRGSTLAELKSRTLDAYQDAAVNRGKVYLIAYHHAVHLAMHCGQIRMLRNLYRTTKGDAPRFFPANPTYPARR